MNTKKYKIRAGFSITLPTGRPATSRYESGSVVDLTEEQFDHYKHMLEEIPEKSRKTRKAAKKEQTKEVKGLARTDKEEGENASPIPGRVGQEPLS